MAKHHLIYAALAVVCLAGLAGFFVLVFPWHGRLAEQNVTITATVPDHGQGSCRGTGCASTAAYSGALPAAVTRLASTTTTLLFVGDMMFDRTVATRSSAAKSTAYPFARIGNLKQGVFGEHDLVIGNLEGPVTSVKKPEPKSIDFSFKPEILSVLKAEGLDAVSQANNHSLDQGSSGAQESLRHIALFGLTPFGSELKDDATSSLAMLEARGKKIALLGFNTTDHGLNRTLAGQAMAQARAAADYVIVFMHWGQEYKDKPNADQTALAHWFIDQGAAAVMGSHPHWMESVETYRGRPIVYSLGNFIFDQDWSRETDYGLVAGLALSPQASELKLFPIKIIKSQPMLLDGAERQVRLDRLAKISPPELSTAIAQGVLALPL